jgi:aspartyl-tRNA(Asn)/glutamyl-tRNA(Gln) amidotransferase subunit A
MRLHVNRIWVNTHGAVSSTRCVSTISDEWRKTIRQKNTSVNALVYTSEPAKTAGQHLRLHDVAIAVKDNICTAFMPTTCSSGMLRG